MSKLAYDLELSLKTGLLLGNYNEPLNDYGKRLVRVILTTLRAAEQPSRDAVLDTFDIADIVIKHVYPGDKLGYWGAQRIPNFGLLRGAIERAVREARDTAIHAAEQAEGRLAGMRKDAERYQWLRANQSRNYSRSDFIYAKFDGELDAAIDAAIESARKE